MGFGLKRMNEQLHRIKVAKTKMARPLKAGSEGNHQEGVKGFGEG